MKTPSEQEQKKALSERALKFIEDKKRIKEHLKSGKSIRDLETKGYRFDRPI